MLDEKKYIGLALTAVFERVPEGYTGFVQEIPGVNTQGETLDDARAGLRDALETFLESMREISDDEIDGKEIVKEQIRLA